MKPIYGQIDRLVLSDEREGLIIEVGSVWLALIVRRSAGCESGRDVTIEAARFYDTQADARAAIERKR